MPHLERDGDIWLLNLGDGQNRFSPAWLGAVNEALDAVENATGPRALVTCADGKVWSTGLDLDWLGEHGDQLADFLRAVHRLLARVLVMPVPTVAAVQGHVFAAGAMLACAHDQTVMRADRGFWCLPEVDLGLNFTPGMDALLRARLPARAAHQAMTTGRRYGGADALAAGLIDATADAGKVVSAAADLAGPLAAKAGPTMGQIKAQMYGSVLAALQAA
jgi:enoyl-CoA hydratase/carnithine racemase